MPKTPRDQRNRFIVDAISTLGSLASVMGVILAAGVGFAEHSVFTTVFLPVLAAALAAVLKLTNRER